MRKTLILLSALTAVGAFAEPTKIVPGYFYPSSIQAGTKVRVITGGMGYGGIHGVWISGDGVKVTNIKNVPDFPRSPGKGQINPWTFDWFYELLGGERTHHELPPEATAADTDWQKNDWLYNLDELDDLELQIVGRYLYTPLDYPQATPALDHLLILDVEAEANAKPGLRTIMLYNGKEMSAPHPFYITSEPHAVEPFFTIPPRAERRAGLSVVLHYTNSIPAQTLPVSLDGQAWPGEVDVFKLQLRKGKRVTCVMNGRELLPYLGDAVPGFFNPVMRLTTADGKEVAFADDFRYLPDPILSCIVPEDGVYRLEISDNLYRGRSDFVYTVKCFEDDLNGPFFVPQQRAFECYPIPGSHLPPTAGSGADLRKGKIDFPGRVVRHDFKVKEPGALSFELFARRLGSQLDGELRLYGPLVSGTPLSAAPLLAKWTDIDKFLCGSVPQAICDARGAWNFLEAGDYCVTVGDETGDGGEDYFYTLAIEPLEPTFEVYALRSSHLMPGGSASVELKIVRRNGFTGEVSIEGNDDFVCSAFFAEGSDTGEMTVTAVNDGWTGMKTANFTATAEIGPDKVRKVPVVPGDPVEQAFAYTHYLPAPHFYFFKPEN